MKKLFSVFFAVFAFTFAFSQKIITGKITDNTGKPLANASITLEEPGKDAILAYSISNAKGEYKISIDTAAPELEMKVKAFNVKPISRSVKNDSQNIDFQMESDITEIKEVKLKTKLITKKGDTISYDLKAFESKNDRTLADVLKKIPGIEVNPDGSVLYQGEPINKFYVNGKDLMEGSYGTVNNSLPKDAVQKVEVLENHQPVKILQDKIGSENAAINVKLKNSVTMTGRAELGAGFSPLLWNAKITPMFFSQKNQWVINYKTNNTGETVEKEGRMFGFGNRFEGQKQSVSQQNWIGVEDAFTPNITESRYLMNKVHFFSANLLTNPFKNKEWELKTSASYTNNDVSRTSLYETQYYTSGLKISQYVANKFYTNEGKADLIFTKNAKKGFFKNTTSFNFFDNADRADVSRNTLNLQSLAAQSLDSPTGSFQNSLSTILPWKDKLFNVQSYVRYQQDRQELLSTPGSYTASSVFPEAANFSTLRQNTFIKTLYTHHEATVGLVWKKLTFTPEIGLDMEFNSLNSDLFGENNGFYTSAGGKYRNDSRWNVLKPYTSLGADYKSGGWNISVQLPLSHYDISFDDVRQNKFQNLSRTVLEPSFFLNKEFASFYRIFAFGNLNYDFGELNSLYSGYILTNPTNLNLRSSELPQNFTRSIGSRLEYRNPLNNLFWNVAYRFSNTDRNLISARTLTPELNLITALPIANTPQTQTERVEVGKYFPKFKSNVSASFTNTDSRSFSYFKDVLANTPPLSEARNSTQNYGFKLNNTYFSWMSVDYNFTYGNTRSQNRTLNTSTTSANWSHELAAYFYPKTGHTLGFILDDTESKFNGKKYANTFYDASYQYTWKEKKIDFEVKVLNLANVKTYERVSFDAATNSETFQKVDIRPRQVMFTVKFNFK